MPATIKHAKHYTAGVLRGHDTTRHEVGDWFRVPGVNYGPRGLQLVQRVKGMAVVRVPGHSFTAGSGYSSYSPQSLIVVNEETGHGFEIKPSKFPKNKGRA